MRTSEVEIDSRITVRVNKAEHRAFKLACMIEGQEMATVMRQLVRDYVAQHKDKQK